METQAEMTVYTKSIFLCSMKNLSLKLDDEIFNETEMIITKLQSVFNREATSRTGRYSG